MSSYKGTIPSLKRGYFTWLECSIVRKISRDTWSKLSMFHTLFWKSFLYWVFTCLDLRNMKLSKSNTWISKLKNKIWLWGIWLKEIRLLVKLHFQNMGALSGMQIFNKILFNLKNRQVFIQKVIMSKAMWTKASRKKNRCRVLFKKKEEAMSSIKMGNLRTK
jgi:hypothetical protein